MTDRGTTGLNVGLIHLRAVVGVADAGGYSAAADELRVAQSSLSRSVQEVERRVGVRLFDRSTRSVVLTPDGVAFVQLAREVVETHDRALAHFTGYLQGVRGVVSVAALPSLAATLLPRVLATFRDARPDVTVEVRDGLSGEVAAMVHSGLVDFALTAAGDTPGLDVIPVATDTFVCVVAHDHPFAQRASLTWSELEGCAFVAFDPTSSLRRLTDEVLVTRGIRVGRTTEARNVAAVAGLVGAGLGVTALPGFVLPMTSFADVVAVPLTDPVAERTIHLLVDPRRPLSPAAQALMSLVRGPGRRQVRLPPGTAWTG